MAKKTTKMSPGHKRMVEGTKKTAREENFLPGAKTVNSGERRRFVEITDESKGTEEYPVTEYWTGIIEGQGRTFEGKYHPQRTWRGIELTRKQLESDQRDGEAVLVKGATHLHRLLDDMYKENPGVNEFKVAIQYTGLGEPTGDGNAPHTYRLRYVPIMPRESDRIPF